MKDFFLNIRNNSHYICNDSSTHYKLINPKSFSCQRAKQMSYFARVYFHYKWVELLGGKSYFYTFTYNDRALPSFHGVPCMKNSDIREFIRLSGFDKKLKRTYGYNLQYFITCELGEGKGKRGLENNPHYHAILFLIPVSDGKSYLPLSDEQFYELCKIYWQGPDYKLNPPQRYKYGICMHGDNLGLITSPSALNYVGKYVLKDNTYYSLFQSLKLRSFRLISDWLLSDKRAVNKLENKLHSFNDDIKQFTEYYNYLLEWSFKRFYKKYIIRECMPKVQISHGVGDFLINFVNDDGVTINIPYKNSYKSINIPLTQYRKLYYDVKKDAAGNNKYVLNDNGINVRVNNLYKKINKNFNDIKPILKLYDYKHDDSDLLKYCVYDIVYRNRLCPSINIPLDLKEDYAMFLYSEFYRSTYLPDREVKQKFIELNSNFTTYIYHPYFYEIKNFIKDIDDLLNYHYICNDIKEKQDYNAIRRCKQFFSKLKFKNFVSNLRK